MLLQNAAEGRNSLDEFVSSKTYDKRDDFDFDTVKMHQTLQKTGTQWTLR